MYLISIINNGKTKILHDPDAKSYRRLLSGQFTEAINQIPSFTFTIPYSNPCYNDELKDRKTIVSVLNTITNEIEFEGTLLTHEENMSDSGKLVKSGVCEGYLGYLCDSVQMYQNYKNTRPVDFLQTLLENHNSQVSADKKIFLGQCDVSDENTNSKTTAYRTTLEEIKINLIERLGGEIRIRKSDGKLMLDYLKQYGTKSSATIELAKNMRSLNVKTDSTNIITRLIPLGCQTDQGETAQRLDISSVNNGTAYIDDEAAMSKYGVIVGTAVFDDITLPENLIKSGRTYLQNNNRVRKAYAAQVLDLSLLDKARDSFRVGNTYRFKNSFMDLDEELRLIKRTVDIYKPYRPSVEIGDKAERITDISVRMARLIEYEMPQQKLDILASAKATATAIINAGINGYVAVNKNEILIMDTPDKATATKVWRWNSGGFGYSDNGYSGEYGTAITMDGAIVADFITAGVLRGLEIVNGDNTFHVSPDGSVTASAINITGGSININTQDETYDVIKLNKGSWHSQVSPLQLRIINDSTGCEIILQAGGIWFKKNGENMAVVSGDGGNIFAKSLAADMLSVIGDAHVSNLYFAMDDAPQSLAAWIGNLDQRIKNLEG